jgi:hypothetical protein
VAQEPQHCETSTNAGVSGKASPSRVRPKRTILQRFKGTVKMTIVYVEGKKYRLIKPEIPDPDYWVRLVPIKEKETTTDKCTHSFYNVYKGDNVTGQRCSKCSKQEWF